jgi:hypothetical protein
MPKIHVCGTAVRLWQYSCDVSSLHDSGVPLVGCGDSIGYIHRYKTTMKAQRVSADEVSAAAVFNRSWAPHLMSSPSPMACHSDGLRVAV